MKLAPATVEAVWGGTRLMDGKWNKKGLGENIAESWELSCHEKGESLVINGEFSSRKLSGVLQDNPDFLGKKGKEFEVQFQLWAGSSWNGLTVGDYTFS